MTAFGIALSLAACGGGDDGGQTLSEAFCADIEAGATPFQLYDPDRYEPAEFADLAYGFAAISCPEQLASNGPLRTYLEAWGINPDVIP